MVASGKLNIGSEEHEFDRLSRLALRKPMVCSEAVADMMAVFKWRLAWNGRQGPVMLSTDGSMWRCGDDGVFTPIRPPGTIKFCNGQPVG